MRSFTSAPVNWLIADERALSSSYLLEQMKADPTIQVVTKQALEAHEDVRISREDKVCVLAEIVLDLALQRMDDPERVRLVKAMKNKIACREMLRDLYPDFYFQPIAIQELPNHRFVPGKKYVLKPVKGYEGTAVRILDDSTDLQQVVVDVERELTQNLAFLSDSVLSKGEFFIEEFIEGDEYAVDMFYSDAGEPVITNIYHHPLPRNLEYLHVVYYTRAQIFRELHDKFIAFFRWLNQALHARALPIHGEFKFDGQRIVPVELNPLRYGGEGLSELTYHAFGFNPFAYFYHDTRPDWQELWAGKPNKIYAWVLGYNGAGMDIEKYRPNFSKFRSLFSNIITDAALNYRKNLAFSVMYIEEDAIEKVYDLVNTDFREFFIGTRAYSEETYREIYRKGTKASVAAGTTLWRQGDLGDYLLLVLEGMLDVVVETGDGRQLLLNTIEPGELVGELSAVDGLPRSATVRARTPCAVMSITGPAFRSLLHHTHELLEELYWLQVDRIRKLMRQITDLGGRA